MIAPTTTQEKIETKIQGNIRDEWNKVLCMGNVDIYTYLYRGHECGHNMDRDDLWKSHTNDFYNKYIEYNFVWNHRIFLGWCYVQEILFENNKKNLEYIRKTQWPEDNFLRAPKKIVYMYFMVYKEKIRKYILIRIFVFL